MIKKLLLLAGLSFSVSSFAQVDSILLDWRSFGDHQSILSSAISGAVNAENDKWEMEYIAPKFVLISVGDILTPILIDNGSVILRNEDKGVFEYADNSVRSVTKTSFISTSHASGVTFPYRPTLYISIPGFGTEKEPHAWQYSLADRLAPLSSTVSGAQVYQHKHFMVSWDSDKSLGSQPRQLEDMVNTFLKNKTLEWDVVIIGHSRGAIFAHELAEKLVSSSKISNLHTYLLDPTASNLFSDHYPSSLPQASGTNHFGSLYYDGLAWLSDSNIDATTVGDRNVSGYQMELFASSSHSVIGDEWVETSSSIEELTDAFAFIRSKKPGGSYAPDGGVSGTDLVSVSAESGLSFDGDITVTDEQLNIWGEITAGGYSIGNIDTTVNLTEIEVSAGTLLATSELIVERDRVQYSANAGLVSYSSNFSLSGAQYTLSDGVVTTSANVDYRGIHIRFSIGGSSFSFSSSDAATGGLKRTYKRARRILGL